jgi:hypothetical protein
MTSRQHLLGLVKGSIATNLADKLKTIMKIIEDVGLAEYSPISMQGVMSGQ